MLIFTRKKSQIFKHPYIFIYSKCLHLQIKFKQTNSRNFEKILTDVIWMWLLYTQARMYIILLITFSHTDCLHIFVYFYKERIKLGALAYAISLPFQIMLLKIRSCVLKSLKLSTVFDLWKNLQPLNKSLLCQCQCLNFWSFTG